MVVSKSRARCCLGFGRVVSVNVASPIRALAERTVLRTMVAMWASRRVKRIAGRAIRQATARHLCERRWRAFGCPARAWPVFDGNTGDPKTLLPQVEKVRTVFGIDRLVMVGDRGMISSVQIDATPSSSAS